MKPATFAAFVAAPCCPYADALIAGRETAQRHPQR